MAQNEIQNVLVLGTTNFRTSQFCKLFEAYLSYNSYEEASKWHSNLNTDDGIERPVIFVNNLYLFCTPNLGDSHISKQIISILANFKEKQSLSAIIILINPSDEGYVHLGKLRSCLFHVLNEFSDSVLYIYAINDDFDKSGKSMKNEIDILENQKRNVFHCNPTTFYNASAANWSQSVEFCKIINNYIIGKGNNCGLETIYIDAKISDKLVLNLITNLTELLILIYICIYSGNYFNPKVFIDEFKRNITVCYGNRCAQTTQCYRMKIPKICHSFCNCIEADINISKCMVFEERDKTCMLCKCKTELHSQNYFKTSESLNDSINQQELTNEKRIIINILVTIYIYKKQNQESLNSEDIFSKFIDMEFEQSKRIFDLFKNEFNQKVEEIETKSHPITNKDLMICITSLYKIKAGASIIPKFMEEIFPKDLQLETVTNGSRLLNKTKIFPKDLRLETVTNGSRSLNKTKISPKVLQLEAVTNGSRSLNKTKIFLKDLQLESITDGSRSLNKTKTPKVLEVELEIKMLKNKVAELEVLMNRILNLIKDNATEKNGNNLDSQLNQEATASSSNVNLDQNTKDNEEKEINWNIKAK